MTKHWTTGTAGKARMPCLKQCPSYHAKGTLAFFTPSYIPLNTPAQKRSKNTQDPVGGKTMCFLLIPWDITGRKSHQFEQP